MDKFFQMVLSCGVVGVTLAVVASYAFDGETWAISLLVGSFLAVMAYWGIEIHISRKAQRATQNQKV